MNDPANTKHRRRVSSIIREKVYKRDNHRCVYCGSENSLSVDHIVPFSRGGSDDYGNLVTCCFQCNLAKGDKLPEEIGWSIGRWPYIQRENDLHWREHVLKRKMVRGPDFSIPWTLKADALPDCSGYYIATFDNGLIGFVRYELSLVDEPSWFDMNETECGALIVAWVRTPEPYTEPAESGYADEV